MALIPQDGLLVACAASPGAMEVARGARSQVVTYGRPGSGADWTFEVVARALGGRATLDVARRGERVVSVETGMPGIYNLENLIGIVAVASALGVEFPAIAGRGAQLPGRPPPAGGARRRRRRHRGR